MMVSLLFLLLAVLLSNCDAAPATYDQRQNGDFNVEAKLDNFLIVFAASATGSSDFFTNLAAQGLDLMNQGSRHVAKKDKDVDSSRYEVEDTHERSKEPYRVEIVHIEKPEENQPKELSDKNEEKSEKPLKELSKDLKDSEGSGKKSRSLSRHDSRSIQGNSGKNEKSEIQTKNSDALNNLDKIEETGQGHQVVNEHVDELKSQSDPGRPGQSLKKELSSKEEKMKDRERNDVEAENKPEELSQISDSKKECGPGKYRDDAGDCQIAAAN